MCTVKDAVFLSYLKNECGYTDLRPLSDNRWVGLYRFMFTYAIIVGDMGDVAGYSDRWCYSDYDKALSALNSWDGNLGTEPTGWHRHPATGRRVTESGENYVSM